jgi:hypothetical protein
LEYTEDDNITFKPNKPNRLSILSDFGDDNHNEVGRASIKGSYSRAFDRHTKLTLVEVTENRALVTADCEVTTSVPEPSTVFAASLAIGVSLGWTSKRKRLK